MSKFLLLAVCQATMTAVVFAAGRRLSRAIGRGSERRRVHGRYVFGWSIGAFAFGPLAWMAAASKWPRGNVEDFGGFIPHAFFLSYACGMFSLLAGWVVGTIHGAVVVVWRDRPTAPNSYVGPADAPPPNERHRPEP